MRWPIVLASSHASHVRPRQKSPSPPVSAGLSFEFRTSNKVSIRSTYFGRRDWDLREHGIGRPIHGSSTNLLVRHALVALGRDRNIRCLPINLGHVLRRFGRYATVAFDQCPNIARSVSATTWLVVSICGLTILLEAQHAYNRDECWARSSEKILVNNVESFKR